MRSPLLPHASKHSIDSIGRRAKAVDLRLVGKSSRTDTSGDSTNMSSSTRIDMEGLLGGESDRDDEDDTVERLSTAMRPPRCRMGTRCPSTSVLERLRPYGSGWNGGQGERRGRNGIGRVLGHTFDATRGARNAIQRWGAAK